MPKAKSPDADPSLKPSGLTVITKGPIQRIPSIVIAPGVGYRSPIREILDVASKPGIRSVAGGLPLNETIETITEEIKQHYDEHLGKGHGAENNYRGSKGEPRLREYGRKLFADKGIKLDSIDNIFVTSAATPANAALAEAGLPLPGGIAIVEGPTYPGGIGALWRRSPQFKQIRVDQDGPLPEDLRLALEDAMDDPNKPNVVWYTTLTGATFGSTATYERKQQYVEIIKDFAHPDKLGNRLLVIEDDPYPDIRLTEEKAPQALTGMLIDAKLPEVAAHVQTFSKLLFPGARTGICYIPKRIEATFQSALENIELYHDGAKQLAIADLGDEGKIDEHRKNLGEAYIPGAQAMEEALERNKERTGWKWTQPRFGFFHGAEVVAEEGQTPLDMDDLFDEAIEKHHVAYVPGKRLFIAPDETGRQAATMRLSHSYPVETIHATIDGIADMIEDHKGTNRRRGHRKN